MFIKSVIAECPDNVEQDEQSIVLETLKARANVVLNSMEPLARLELMELFADLFGDATVKEQIDIFETFLKHERTA